MKEPKQVDDQEPLPYTFIQTYATRLVVTWKKLQRPFFVQKPKINMKQGKLAVIFSADNFLVKWIDR